MNSFLPKRRFCLVLLIQLILAFLLVKTQMIFPEDDSCSWHLPSKYFNYENGVINYDEEWLEEQEALDVNQPSEVPEEDDPHCVWYGKCKAADGTDKTLPCFDNSTGRVVYENTNKWCLMKLFCPDFLVDTEPRVCCSIRTILVMNIELSSYQGLLNRCPSCWDNYRKFLCTLNCAPNQSQYMVVTNTTSATPLLDW